MPRIAALAMALVLAGAAPAQTLYQCRSNAMTSYQQTPCPHAARTVRTIETTPEAPPTAAQLAAQAWKSRQDRADSAYLSHLAGTDQPLRTRFSATRYGNAWSRSTQGDPRRDACKAAKASRESMLRAIGLNRTIDLLRRLDDEVGYACQRR